MDWFIVEKSQLSLPLTQKMTINNLSLILLDGLVEKLRETGNLPLLRIKNDQLTRESVKLKKMAHLFSIREHPFCRQNLT